MNYNIMVLYAQLLKYGMQAKTYRKNNEIYAIGVFKTFYQPDGNKLIGMINFFHLRH